MQQELYLWPRTYQSSFTIIRIIICTIKHLPCPSQTFTHKHFHLLITGAEAAAFAQVRQVFLCLFHVRVDLIQSLLYALQLLYGRRQQRGVGVEEEDEEEEGGQAKPKKKEKPITTYFPNAELKKLSSDS